MNKDTIEGTTRSAIGQGEKIFGQATGDGSLSARGAYDNVAGKVQSAAGNAKEAVNSGIDAVSSIDVSGLRDEVATLSRNVSDLLQKQASATKDQVVGALGAASDNFAQSASVAQDKFVGFQSCWIVNYANVNNDTDETKKNVVEFVQARYVEYGINERVLVPQ